MTEKEIVKAIQDNKIQLRATTDNKFVEMNWWDEESQTRKKANVLVQDVIRGAQLFADLNNDTNVAGNNGQEVINNLDQEDKELQKQIDEKVDKEDLLAIGEKDDSLRYGVFSSRIIFGQFGRRVQIGEGAITVEIGHKSKISISYDQEDEAKYYGAYTEDKHLATKKNVETSRSMNDKGVELGWLKD